MTTLKIQNPLGQPSSYPRAYCPEQLFVMPRQMQRNQLGLNEDTLPFMGADLWTAFEVAWCAPSGKPHIGIAHITVDCQSPYLIESKSLKLYFMGLAHAVFEDVHTVQRCIETDLSRVLQSPVQVEIRAADQFDRERIGQLEGLCLDRLEIECTDSALAPNRLQVDTAEPPVEENLVSHLLKSHCAVTGQPDWGSVQVCYVGHPIDQAGLLRYLVSFRHHQEFHEHCVERIFMDIWQRCAPVRLQVYARYTRRGGIDINPFRTSYPAPLPSWARLARQ
jgi:7-cyano-7-deazaguanine reductase